MRMGNTRKNSTLSGNFLVVVATILSIFMIAASLSPMPSSLSSEAFASLEVDDNHGDQSISDLAKGSNNNNEAAVQDPGGLIGNMISQQQSPQAYARNVNTDNKVIIVENCEDGEVTINDNDQIIQTNTQSFNQEANNEAAVQDPGGLIGNMISQQQSPQAYARNVNTDNKVIIVENCEDGEVTINDNDQIIQTNTQSFNQEANNEAAVQDPGGLIGNMISQQQSPQAYARNVNTDNKVIIVENCEDGEVTINDNDQIIQTNTQSFNQEANNEAAVQDPGGLIGNMISQQQSPQAYARNVNTDNKVIIVENCEDGEVTINDNDQIIQTNTQSFNQEANNEAAVQDPGGLIGNMISQQQSPQAYARNVNTDNKVIIVENCEDGEVTINDNDQIIQTNTQSFNQEANNEAAVQDPGGLIGNMISQQQSPQAYARNVNTDNKVIIVENCEDGEVTINDNDQIIQTNTQSFNQEANNEAAVQDPGGLIGNMISQQQSPQAYARNVNTDNKVIIVENCEDGEVTINDNDQIIQTNTQSFNQEANNEAAVQDPGGLIGNMISQQQSPQAYARNVNTDNKVIIVENCEDGEVTINDNDQIIQTNTQSFNQEANNEAAVQDPGGLIGNMISQQQSPQAYARNVNTDNKVIIVENCEDGEVTINDNDQIIQTNTQSFNQEANNEAAVQDPGGLIGNMISQQQSPQAYARNVNTDNKVIIVENCEDGEVTINDNDQIIQTNTQSFNQEANNEAAVQDPGGLIGNMISQQQSPQAYARNVNTDNKVIIVENCEDGEVTINDNDQIIQTNTQSFNQEANNEAAVQDPGGLIGNMISQQQSPQAYARNVNTDNKVIIVENCEDGEVTINDNDQIIQTNTQSFNQEANNEAAVQDPGGLIGNMISQQQSPQAYARNVNTDNKVIIVENCEDGEVTINDNDQ